MNDQPRDLLREWATAERMAIQAEEMVRTALANHVNFGSSLPTQAMQNSANELRKNADHLFDLVRQKDGVSGS
jgi:hypothetical protein